MVLRKTSEAAMNVRMVETFLVRGAQLAPSRALVSVSGSRGDEHEDEARELPLSTGRLKSPIRLYMTRSLQAKHPRPPRSGPSSRRWAALGGSKEF